MDIYHRAKVYAAEAPISMWTILYKNFYIQGYTGKPECTISGRTALTGKVFKSLRSAKIAIGKHIKENPK